MASARVSENLECSICSDIFLDPRALPCGHSYCGPPRNCLDGIKHDKGRASKCAICNEVFQISVTKLKPLYGIREAISSLAAEEDVVQSEDSCNHPVSRRKIYCIDCSTTLCGVCVENFHSDHKIKGYTAMLNDLVLASLPHFDDLEFREFHVDNEMKKLQNEQKAIQKLSENKEILTEIVKSSGKQKLSTEVLELVIKNFNEAQMIESIGKELKSIEFTTLIDNISLHETGDSTSAGYELRGYIFRTQCVVHEHENKLWMSLYLAVESSDSLNKTWTMKLKFNLVLVNKSSAKNIEKGFVEGEFNSKNSSMGYSECFSECKDIDKEEYGFVNQPNTITVKVRIDDLKLY